MNLITTNLTEALLILGIALLAIEMMVLGFSTFILFFIGLASIITGIGVSLGLIPETVAGASLSITLVSVILSVFLWAPLKRMQTKVDTTKAKSDLVGYRFTLNEDVSSSVNVKHKYSGIEWLLVSPQALGAGTMVEVTEVEVGAFHIAPVLE